MQGEKNARARMIHDERTTCDVTDAALAPGAVIMGIEMRDIFIT
jgi:hypothetical protein